MDYDDLSDDVLLYIFKLIPLNVCVRLGRLNKRCRRISLSRVSEIKSLNLCNDIFRKLTGDPMSWILDLCSNKLEFIKFPHFTHQSVITAFSQFNCPNLLELDLKYAPYDAESFTNIIKRNRNLKILKCDVEKVTYPDDIVSRNLMVLITGRCFDDALVSMTGRMPNLEHLETEFYGSYQVFDQFLEGCPKLQKLVCHGDKLMYDVLPAFWNLQNLTTLRITFNNDVDATRVMNNLAQSFTNLQTVILKNAYITNVAISRLSTLTNLRDLTLHNRPIEDINASVQQLAKKCRKLQKLRISAPISHHTLVTLVDWCRDMKLVWIATVMNIDHSKDATDFIQTLVTMLNENAQLIIQLSYQDRSNQLIWMDKNVQGKLKGMQSEKWMITIEQTQFQFTDG